MHVADDAPLAELTVLLERLHRHKDAAYGDAWRKRGEVIAIFANLARKYDRLLVAFDEQRPAATDPLGDTVADLCVYAAKYLTWIAELHPAELDRAGLPVPAANQIAANRGPDALRLVLEAVAATVGQLPPDSAAARARVRADFETLEAALMAQASPDAPGDRLLDFTAKARLAWALAADSATLLACLEQDDPRTTARLRDQVTAMDRAAGRR
jgi:hypothetical protein